MKRLTALKDIERPVEDVFEYVAEQRNYTSWCPKLTRCELTSDGQMGLGASKIVSRKALGLSFDWEFTCDEYDPPTRMVWHCDNDPRISIVDILEFEQLPDDAGTRVVHHADFQLLGPYKLLKPLAIRRARKDLAGDLANLKEILEGRTEAQAH